MWRKRVEVYHEPACELMDEELQIVIPVCRDRLRDKMYRMEKWRQERWKVEKIESETCQVCKPPKLKEVIQNVLSIFGW